MDDDMGSVLCLPEVNVILFKLFRDGTRLCCLAHYPQYYLQLPFHQQQRLVPKIKNHRKESLINSLNTPSTEKHISLRYISRNGLTRQHLLQCSNCHEIYIIKVDNMIIMFKTSWTISFLYWCQWLECKQCYGPSWWSVGIFKKKSIICSDVIYSLVALSKYILQKVRVELFFYFCFGKNTTFLQWFSYKQRKLNKYQWEPSVFICKWMIKLI